MGKAWGRWWRAGRGRGSVPALGCPRLGVPVGPPGAPADHAPGLLQPAAGLPCGEGGGLKTKGRTEDGCFLEACGGRLGRGGSGTRCPPTPGGLPRFGGGGAPQGRLRPQNAGLQSPPMSRLPAQVAFLRDRGDFPPPEQQVLKAEAPRGQAVEVRSLCFVSNKLEKCVSSEKKELTQLCAQCMLKKPFWF